MAHDEDLAERVRAMLPADGAVTERQMFGGLAFMVNVDLLAFINSHRPQPAQPPHTRNERWPSRYTPGPAAGTILTCQSQPCRPSDL